MKIYQVGEQEKCGGCNLEVSKVFFAANSQEEADEMYRENQRGLCAACLIKLFQEYGYEITKQEEEGYSFILPVGVGQAK